MVDTVSGRAASPNRLSSSTEPASGLRPSGFDPARGLHILQHSLGVDRFGQGTQYRNHFVTGEGSLDHPDCCALVDAGLMTRHRGNPLTGGDDAFFVTEAGKRYVAENSPAPPKLTRGQRRYREWLSVSDVTGESFIEFCRRRDRDRSAEGGQTAKQAGPKARARASEGGIAK